MSYNPSLHLFRSDACFYFCHCYPLKLLYKLHTINMKLLLHLHIATDQENSTNPTPRLDQSFDSTAVVALLATVVIVLLVVMIILGILFCFYFKKKKVRGTDMARGGRYIKHIP